ncbi:hypothetical protein [Methanogenium sp. MK-MG]|uniref:hypothetical protein n=1 Tax=Methanogenium sp. MK-MG TaxID=2599926 RepID=UPI0013ED29F2|nr:hypothetical protein [Methanogenium sp. MK-MG]KAF1076636.1 hypothetical protein MKMG_01450 [Methanogenium sp. MK-MG]
MSGYQFPLALLLCLVAAAVLACGCTDGGVKDPDAVSGAGTVVYNDFEGGFYGIVTDDGTRYLPLNLPDEFAQDNLSVTFAGTVQKDVVTIQQWGTPLELSEISSGDKVVKIESGV